MTYQQLLTARISNPLGHKPSPAIPWLRFSGFVVDAHPMLLIGSLRGGA